MKHLLTLVLLLGLTLTPGSSGAAIVTPPVAELSALHKPETFVELDRAEMEQLLGRRMKLKERIAFGMAKRRVARQLARQDQEGAAPTTNGMAVAGFVCGIVGLFVFGIVLGPLAIVFSAIGLSKSNKEGRPLRGLAIAGLVLGIVGVIGWAIVVASI